MTPWPYPLETRRDIVHFLRSIEPFLDTDTASMVASHHREEEWGTRTIHTLRAVAREVARRVYPRRRALQAIAQREGNGAYVKALTASLPIAHAALIEAWEERPAKTADAWKDAAHPALWSEDDHEQLTMAHMRAMTELYQKHKTVVDTYARQLEGEQRQLEEYLQQEFIEAQQAGDTLGQQREQELEELEWRVFVVGEPLTLDDLVSL